MPRRNCKVVSRAFQHFGSFSPSRGLAKTRTFGLAYSGAALLVLVPGCATEPPPTAYVPPKPVVVDVLEQDYGYIFNPGGDIPTGRIVFQVRNQSGLAHDLSLVVLPEDMPAIIDQLRSPNRRAIVTRVRLPSHDPGSSDAFAVDLAPGRYALLCFERDGTGGVHALEGMAVEFRVRS